MKKFELTAYDLAQRFVGVREIAGTSSSPQVLAMLRLDENWPAGDHVAWCSAFVNYIAWLLRLPRSKSLRARSWLAVGVPIGVGEAEVGNDVVILQRGENSPPPDFINAPGHVGFFAGWHYSDTLPDKRKYVLLLGGNQDDAVNISSFPAEKILGIRRLA